MNDCDCDKLTVREKTKQNPNETKSIHYSASF